MYGGGGGGGHYDGGSGGAGNANALFGGGGFMPSQSTVVPENSGLSKVLPNSPLFCFLSSICSPSYADPSWALPIDRCGGQGRSAQTLLPLTVKQTMDAAQTSGDRSNFAINGVEVSTIRLVGRMLGKVERVTDVVFTLDDGTGKIDVNRWENEASDAKEMADAKRVTNFNEITCHFLHCIQVHMELTGLKVDGNYISNLVLSVFHDPSVMDQEHGLHIKDVIDRLKLPDDVVSAAIQGHVDVGNIYNTIDDFHYKSVRNG
ncbi:hypothetical protein Zm00014a_027160 [Zea mays]|uniref:Replication protein A C-terminal domain-containing protein n=1 Tax=Zea mays TaxID=4577 RepID=A0A3L6EHH9_MAIZE|nr:hypothetical protein Zm00014a_027160 [Zea mays]